MARCPCIKSRLTLALLADVCARNLRPAALFAFLPCTDSAMTGETLRNRAKADPLLPVAWIEEALGFVVGYLAPKDPRISPLNASFPGAPPVLIQVVTTEILYDDSRRMAANLRGFGGDVTLSEWDKAPHVLQIFGGHIPQARKVLCDVAEFIRTKTS